MGKIVVFDSGLGSLSIIQAIRKITKAEIIYFADQKHYPYGTKTKKELKQIIESTIQLLQKQFNPDVIVVGSNTPTILFPDLFVNKAIVGVTPPLEAAIKRTKTNSIAILGTMVTIKSKELDNYVNRKIPTNVLVTKIDATELIDLVESGKFLNNSQFCKNKIKNVLSSTLSSKRIDVATLSSTHLPFLGLMLQEMFPHILFLDPAVSVAEQIIKKKNFHSMKRNTLTIFTSGNANRLENKLRVLKIKNKVCHLEF